jgi:hypothetical protein
MKSQWLSVALAASVVIGSPAAQARTKVFESKSEFDSSVTLYVNPHAVGLSREWSTMTLGASWNSSAPDVVLIGASSTLRSLPTSLSFNVDGRIIELTETAGGPTVHRPIKAIEVGRTFTATLDQFREISTGARVLIRLQTVDGYADFPLIDGKVQPAYSAFNMLLARISQRRTTGRSSNPTRI